MASIIRIKRSETSGNPSTLAAGELAYSGLTDNGSNGGDRLYIGIGTETAGDAANHYVIGGKYFTDRLDHTAGTLTASSAIVVDANKKIDDLLVDNLQLNGNTISSTDTDGDITITPNGTGRVQLKQVDIWQSSAYVSLTEFIQDVAGGGIADSAEIDSTYDDDAGTTSLVLIDGSVANSRLANSSITISDGSNSNGVDLGDTLTIAGGNGLTSTHSTDQISLAVNVDDSSIEISSDALQVKASGITNAMLAGSIANSKLTNSTITLAGDSGSNAVDLGDTLTVSGDTGITTSVSGDTVTIDLDDTAVTAGSYGSATQIPTFTVDAQGRLTAAGTANVATQLTVGADSGSDDTVDLLTDTLTVAGGANVTTTVSDNQVSVALDTDLNSLTSVDVDNITIDGNDISTTDTDGDLTLTPNGEGTVTVPSGYESRTGFTDDSLVNKSYVDAVANGLDVKASVRVATTADLSATYDNGAGTLTADSNGAISVDGVTLSVNDRVLVKDQSDAVENGFYKVTTTGGASAAFVLTRTPDGDEDSEVTGGAFTFVEEGTSNADNGYVATHNGTPTLGTDDITFNQFSGAGQISAGNGLTKTGNTIDAVGTSNRITVGADSIDIASTYVGQTSITTLGTITTGTWAGDSIPDNKIDNNLTINNGTIDNSPIGSTTESSGAFTTLSASTSLSISATTDSSSTSTGSITTSGGLGVAKAIYVGTNLTGAGASTSELSGFNIDGGTY